MKSVDVKSSTHINFVKRLPPPPQKKKKMVRGSFVIKKVKANVRWTYLIEDLNRKKLLQCFIKKNC